MEKVLSCSVGGEEEFSVANFKGRLEQIMATFHQEKEQYDYDHNQRIRQLEKEIAQKNQMILILRKDLKNTCKQLDQSEKETEKYRRIVAELKLEFFKMGHVVDKIRTHFEISPNSTNFNLSRVTSDQILSKQSSFKSQTTYSPIKTVRFDINGYFNKVKESNPVKKELYYLESKKSIKTKNTDQHSSKDSLSQKMPTETMEFKELLNNGLGIYSKLRDVKSSLKNIKIPNDKFTGSQLQWAKENQWHTNS